MIVMKFGGTSVQDAAAIIRAAEIVSGVWTARLSLSYRQWRE
jgi:aspartokinase